MIYIRDLVKSFANNHVLNNLNLNVGKGDIYAIVGKNGAGKTTLMRLLSGLLVPDSGSISINSNKTVGVLLGGDVHLYGNLTSLEILHYFGVLHGLPSAYISARIVELNSVLNFNDYLTRKAKELSRGMRQKIAFAVAIIHDPDVLLLDEPSTGLDVESANDVIDFIKYLKTQNKTIIIATHNIYEITELSDYIAFLCDGRIRQVINTKESFLSVDSNARSKYLIKSIQEGNYESNNCNNKERVY